MAIGKGNLGGSAIKEIVHGQSTMTSATTDIAISLADYEFAVVEVTVAGNVGSQTIENNETLLVSGEITSNINLRLRLNTYNVNVRPIVNYTITQFNRAALKKAITKVIDSGAGSDDITRDVTISSVNLNKTKLFTSFTTSNSLDEHKFAIVGSRLLDSTTIRTTCHTGVSDLIDTFTAYIQIIEFN
jgi:hypothetical protein